MAMNKYGLDNEEAKKFEAICSQLFGAHPIDFDESVQLFDKNKEDNFTLVGTEVFDKDGNLAFRSHPYYAKNHCAICGKPIPAEDLGIGRNNPAEIFPRQADKHREEGFNCCDECASSLTVGSRLLNGNGGKIQYWVNTKNPEEARAKLEELSNELIAKGHTGIIYF